jgi:hypothetical protein
VETTGELSFCLLGSEEADNLQDPFMASIFGQNNDSKYQKNRLEAMKVAEGLAWDASSFYLTRSMTGDHGGLQVTLRPRRH